MAKITLGQVTHGSFTAAVQNLMNQPLLIATAFKLKATIDGLNKHIANHSSLKQVIIERYCNKKEDGKPLIDENNMYTFPPETVPDLNKELLELNSIEIDIDTISLEELKDVKLTTNQLFDLGSLIEQPKDNK
jgi:hypothetical protein